MFWQSVLKHVLRIVYKPLERGQIRWALIGSAASALQVLTATLFDRPLAELNDEGIGTTEKRPRRAS